jgi:predicted nucleic acid-binding protein
MIDTVKSGVYLDTSVISALFDERTPERRALTGTAWERLDNYNVFISEIVLDELKNTAQPLRDKMLAVVSNFNVLSGLPPVFRTAC